MNKKKVEHLSIFLVKPEYDNILDIIKTSECQNPVMINLAGYGSCPLYLKSSQTKYPKWSSLFADDIDLNIIGKVSSVSAAFVIKVEERFYIITFGQGGRFLIKDDICEERFGLLVALNSVDKDSLRCIDKQSLDTLESHTRVQSGQATSADQFGIDVEQDMLKAIVGTPSDPNLGHRITGTDSLSVTVALTLSELPLLLKEYRKKFEQDLDEDIYEWVNNISIIKSTSLIDNLNLELIKKFSTHDHSDFWLSIPEIIDWTIVRGFTYTSGKKVIHPDISMNGFKSTIGKEPITLELLKSRNVFCTDADNNHAHKHWSIFKCLYAEVNYKNEKYILNNGSWFKVNYDFVEKTNLEFNKIKYSDLSLPEYIGYGEGYYNKSVAASFPKQFTLLDQDKIFHGGGHGQIEVCDLFSINKELIHIKIYGKSSVLSHLFSQGFVSGQLIQLDQDFKVKFKNKLSGDFCKLINVEGRPAEKELTIIFGIISDSPEKYLHLPFFSKVNLNNTHKVLLGFGYDVKLLKINVNENFSKTVNCPPSYKI